jgi:hypothetical protein
MWCKEGEIWLMQKNVLILDQEILDNWGFPPNEFEF